MKFLSLTLMFLLSGLCLAQEIECDNVSPYWEADLLAIDLKTMRGRYFDNDQDYVLVCERGAYDDDASIYCTREWSETELMTRIEENGKATVIYSHSQWVDFECDFESI